MEHTLGRADSLINMNTSYYFFFTGRLFNLRELKYKVCEALLYEKQWKERIHESCAKTFAGLWHQRQQRGLKHSAKGSDGEQRLVFSLHPAHVCTNTRGVQTETESECRSCPHRHALQAAEPPSPASSGVGQDGRVFTSVRNLSSRWTALQVSVFK